MSPAEFDTLLAQLIEDELLHQLPGCSNVGSACEPGDVMTNPMWQLGGMTNQVPRERMTKEELLLGSSSSSFEDLEELLNAALQQPQEEVWSGAAAAATAPLAAAAAAAPGSVAALQQPQDEGVWSMPIRAERVLLPLQQQQQQDPESLPQEGCAPQHLATHWVVCAAALLATAASTVAAMAAMPAAALSRNCTCHSNCR
jgi:hypothetical protein